MEKPEKIDMLLERLKKAIPEFLGYHDKAYIADSDRVLRYNLASVLERLKLEVEKIRDAIFIAGRLSSSGELEDIALKIGRLAKSFRKSSFEAAQERETLELSEERLETIYEYDLDLLDHIEALNTPIDRLEELKDSPEEFNRELAFLNEILDDIEEHYKRRGHFMS